MRLSRYIKAFSRQYQQMNNPEQTILTLTDQEWMDGQSLLQKLVQKKKATMLRVLQLQEKISSTDKLLGSYEEQWDEMYERFNRLCSFQQNIVLHTMVSNPPVKERDEYTKEIEGCYIELEKYKAYFANILPYQANQLTCGICQETSSSYVVLLPCSHTCCVDCGTRLTSCHICRKKINTRQNLYL